MADEQGTKRSEDNFAAKSVPTPGSKKVVYAAVIANLAIDASKYIAAAVT